VTIVVDSSVNVEVPYMNKSSSDENEGEKDDDDTL
jgi:hypothetical protein